MASTAPRGYREALPGKALLLQARRPNDPAREHERECFLQTAALADGALTCHDLLAGPPPLGAAMAYGAILIGGSGDFFVSKRDLPYHDEILGFLLEVIEAGHPTFGSCFGYQLFVEALGGTIAHDPERTEVGTYEVTLTPAGRSDELFGGLPPRFPAQMGHKDRATRQPGGIPNLAVTERSPLQALRIPGKPIWATQFHPELDRRSNLERFEGYIDSYAPHLSPDERSTARERFRDSPEASSLLRSFLEMVAS